MKNKHSSSLPSSSSSRGLLRRRALPAGDDHDVRDILRLNDGRHVLMESEKEARKRKKKKTNACALNNKEESEE